MKAIGFTTVLWFIGWDPPDISFLCITSTWAKALKGLQTDLDPHSVIFKEKDLPATFPLTALTWDKSPEHTLPP